MRFRAAILAGGASRRMGRDKAFVEVDGLPLVRRIADCAIEAGAESVVVVGGDQHRLAQVGLSRIPDLEPGGGPVQAIVASLRDGPSRSPELVMVLACDLVSPTAAAIRTTVATLDDAPTAALAVPMLDGRPQWLHACWRRELAVEALASAFDRGTRSITEAVVGLPLVAVDGVDPGALTDADAPGDLDPLADQSPDGP